MSRRSPSPRRRISAPRRRTPSRSPSPTFSRKLNWNEFQQRVEGYGLSPQERADLYERYRDGSLTLEQIHRRHRKTMKSPPRSRSPRRRIPSPRIRSPPPRARTPSPRRRSPSPPSVKQERLKRSRAQRDLYRGATTGDISQVRQALREGADPTQNNLRALVLAVENKNKRATEILTQRIREMAERKEVDPKEVLDGLKDILELRPNPRPHRDDTWKVAAAGLGGILVGGLLF